MTRAGAGLAASQIACERFLTVLSPEGDACHSDHLHPDRGCHGKTCACRICACGHERHEAFTRTGFAVKLGLVCA